MHDPGHAPKEQSNPLVFVPLLLLGLYCVYLVTSIPFAIGQYQGLSEAPLKPPPSKAGADEEEVFDQRKLVYPTKELVDLGERLYGANCASCHGDTGHGDGSAAANLAVKPRNYASPKSEFKNGTSAIAMYKTLEKGLGSMPNFPALNPKQKYAVIHYIHANFMKEYDEVTKEMADALPGPAAAVAVKIDPYKESRIPIEFAIEKIAHGGHGAAHSAGATHGHGHAAAPATQGAALYAKHCASCHGAAGEGSKPAELYTTQQLRGLARGSDLLDKGAAWRNDEGAFRAILAKGIPGGLKPKFGTFTADEMKALHEFCRGLH